mmetsp:Transcript_7074/g.11916  ORF Transcript_7074/g.11916 Transcript_7074/m.11916 type:complete len:462 (-) Transcript_7074:120-1505(-)|eukprot:CAMPEP_0168620914 /NCGR_PEP_ID=MMETSP0449_2-20121227/7401_1 /TAXON_ID=1082188 /ORGANISM="Strombidium rassoulzadegani, Strain ras09" /LENGTH=461 /DNA_ID=CAMNT_0008661971 /DNA_START=28 /DNA_END=1413 /DNA_ORIENTATION=+
MGPRGEERNSFVVFLAIVRLLNLSPAYQSEVVVDSPAHGDLVANVGADRLEELDPHAVLLHVHDLASQRLAAHVYHQNLVQLQRAHLVFLLAVLVRRPVIRLDSEQALQQEVGHVDFAQHFGHLARVPDYLTDEGVGPSDKGVDLHADADEPTRHGVHEQVLVGLQRGYLGLNFAALHGACPLVLGDEAGPDRDLVPHLEHALQNGAARHASLKRLCVLSRLVDIEGADDDHLGGRDEVAQGHGNPADVVDDGFDVVADLGGDGDYGGVGGDRALHELLDVLHLLCAGVLVLDNNINLVLQDDDLIQVHDLHRRQVLTRLGLGAGLVPRDQQQGRVHDRGARQHGGHEDIVTGAVDEGDVPEEEQVALTLLALGVVLLARLVGLEALGGRALGALVELRVGVPQLDRDLPDFLLVMSDRVDSGHCFHEGRFAVGHMADGADVLGSLSRNDLGLEGSDLGNV